MTFDRGGRLYGLEVALDPESEPPPGVLTVRRRRGPAPATMRRELEPDHARLDVAGRLTITVRRDPREAVITSPDPIPDDLVAHPLLAWIATVVARWRGDTPLHGAAVVMAHRAWVLLGQPGSGKTTLATALSLAGAPVLADDLSVVRAGAVQRGPAAADLREEAALRLGVGVELRKSLGRPRWRVDLHGEVPDEAPLGGFVALSWSDEPRLDPVGPAGRLSTLAAHEAFGLGPSTARAFLDLLPYPVWHLGRSRTWDALDDDVLALQDLAQRAT